MKVLKFGGTSVGSVESLQIVRQIIEEKLPHDKLVVVVSALSGVTSQLLDCANQASYGNKTYESILAELEERHLRVATQLIGKDSSEKQRAKIIDKFKKLRNLFQGVYFVKELSRRVKDSILSYGEILSSYIIHEYLKAQGISNALMNPRKVIITDSNFGKANVDFNVTNEKIIEYFEKSKNLVVVPGFVAGTAKGSTITLGRGGSDYTAAILAGALKVDALEIWTDVNGMMTADPRMVSTAHTIEYITYQEAMELSHFGAKVIYPPSIHPVLGKKIPTYVKNTFDKDGLCTRISTVSSNNSEIIKGISSVKNISLLNLTGSGMVGVPSFSNRLFKALSEAHINVIMITQASSEHSICVGINDCDVEAAEESINKEFVYEMSTKKINELEVEQNLAVVALVGEKMHHHVGVSGKMFESLGLNGINIKAIAQGSSERNITAVIDEHHLRKALNALHESFFLSRRKKLNLYMIGVGNVGGTLLDQIAAQHSYLLENEQIDLRVVGIANSKRMHFEMDGIDLENWKNTLMEKGVGMDNDLFMGKIKKFNLINSVFIDNTANADIAALYKDALLNNISIVTPNKIACASAYENYKELKNISQEYNSRYLFETNVGAGLPIISTLSDLIKSGDKINKIQAVLSGSLNFIFNYFNADTKFADIVKQAQVDGYTEPDPRIDLSGIDVMRKILILVRESGFKLELEDIKSEPFIPEDCMKTKSVDDFYKGIQENEAHFQKIFAKAAKAGKRLKYVATFDKGEASVGLQEIPSDHPFYNLEGKDNIVLFFTNRYSEQPLVIKGAGAGASVTASGIFADIMKIANS
ncbi:MAG: bifunctional aspartate kinase/homoserine dehydrogenase I [Cyclobacteriaceae bacterium]